MTIQLYIENLNKRFQTGISREHAYRGDLQQYLETLLKDVQVINDTNDKRVKAAWQNRLGIQPRWIHRNQQIRKAAQDLLF
ncbi:MAG: hypothetical protein ACI837_002741 [Crocinitomicaceae bacterium]|jgi:hypothetical protein